MSPNVTSIGVFSIGVYAFVPLPWRVLFLIGFAILCWASNLHFLHLLHLDTAYVLDMHSRANLPYSRIRSSSPSSSSTSSPPPAHLYSAVYKILMAYSAWCFACWLLFRVLCAGDVRSMDHYKLIPSICVFVILVVLFSPLNLCRRRERQLFLQGLYRCFFSVTDVYFSDVLLADILTSLAKIIGDMWLFFLMLLPSGSFLIIPAQEGWLQWIVPLTMCLPYAARLRQCLTEYFASSSTTTTTTNKRALFNALKYSTSFPVIFLSAAQRLVVTELAAEKGPEILHSPWHGEHPLFRFWLLAVIINSGYSFWWDVTNDWGLSMFQPTTSTNIGNHTPSSPTNNDSYPETKYPKGLRSILLFNDPFVYYMAISLNLVLRFTWSLKLSSHLHTIADLEGGIFMLEALELIRRWLWVFFRIEWETVKKSGGDPAGRTGSGHEDIEIDPVLNVNVNRNH